MNRQVHGAETARLFSLSVFLMNTPAFMNTSLLTLNLINSGPVSLSLRQPISFHIQASFSPDESPHTKLPLCFNVCQLCRRCAAKLWQYCWKCVGTHGASKQEFTVQSQVLKQPFFFTPRESEADRKWSKKWLGDQKINPLGLLHLIELICPVYRENFLMNIFLLQGRGLDRWQVQRCQLHPFSFTELAEAQWRAGKD